MNLVLNNTPLTDLTKIQGVTGIFCSISDSGIQIFLECVPGKEKDLYETLPRWLHSRAVLSCVNGAVCIEAINNNN